MSLETLPADVIRFIASTRYTRVRDILNLARCSKRLHVMLTERSYWIRLAEKRTSSRFPPGSEPSQALKENRLESWSLQDIQKLLHPPALLDQIKTRKWLLNKPFQTAADFDFTGIDPKYDQERKAINELERNLNLLRLLYGDFPQRGHVKGHLSAEEAAKLTDMWNTGKADLDIASKYPRETLLIFYDPSGKVIMTYWLYKQYGETGTFGISAPAPVWAEANDMLWPPWMIERIYDLPYNLITLEMKLQK